MGLFGRNTTSLGAAHYDVVANENYRGIAGALVALTESYVNDQAIFEAVIGQDFMEAFAIAEGCELEVVSEASLGGAFDKLKDFVKKIWAKIKGLFQSFIVKLNNVVIRDNKKFVEKYKGKVTSNRYLSKMKYKWAEPKDEGFKNLENATKDYEKVTVSKLDTIFKDKLSGVKDLNEKMDDGDVEDELLGLFAEGTDKSSFDKDVHENCFEEVEEVEGLDTSRVSYLMKVLVGSAKGIEAIEKSQKDCDRFFNDVLKSIDSAQKGVLKAIGTGKDSVSGDIKDIKISKTKSFGGSFSSEKEAMGDNERLSVAHRYVSLLQTCYTRGISALMRETKAEIKQARSVFAKAAAFRATSESMFNDNTYLDAVAESAAFEVESSFEDFE